MRNVKSVISSKRPKVPVYPDRQESKKKEGKDK
jgi:hypothetical protein